MKKAKKVLSFLTAAMMLGGVAVPAEPVAQLGAVLTAGAEMRPPKRSLSAGRGRWRIISISMIFRGGYIRMT